MVAHILPLLAQRLIPDSPKVLLRVIRTLLRPAQLCLTSHQMVQHSPEISLRVVLIQVAPRQPDILVFMGISLKVAQIQLDQPVVCDILVLMALILRVAHSRVAQPSLSDTLTPLVILLARLAFQDTYLRVVHMLQARATVQQIGHIQLRRV